MAVQRSDARGGAWDIWTIELTRGTESRFTFEASPDTVPIWSPDGSRVVFVSNRKGFYDLYQKPSSGAGKDELHSRNPKTLGDLWILPMTGDGRWVAYQSDETGRFEVYVQRYPASEAKWQISTAGGTQPRWRTDGKELFYVATDRKLMSMTVQAGAKFEAGLPRALFETRMLASSVVNPNTYDPTPEGRRFLMIHRRRRVRRQSSHHSDQLAGRAEQAGGLSYCYTGNWCAPRLRIWPACWRGRKIALT